MTRMLALLGGLVLIGLGCRSSSSLPLAAVAETAKPWAKPAASKATERFEAARVALPEPHDEPAYHAAERDLAQSAAGPENRSASTALAASQASSSLLIGSQEAESLQPRARENAAGDVATVAFQQIEPAAPQQEEPSVGPQPSGTSPWHAAPDADTPRGVELDDVLDSVMRHFPLLINAQLEREVARGRLTEQFGEFDLQVKAYSLDQPMGYYKNYRQGLGMVQPTFNGGYLGAGYKIGDGDFEPWFGERETAEGGEFSIGGGIPLWKNRAIDGRRADILTASLALEQVEPQIQQQVLGFLREAGMAYWSWVAARQALEVQRDLLDLALERTEQVEQRVEVGDLPEAARLDNQRLIASRQTKLISSEQKVATASVKLSLYLRDTSGRPQVLPVELEALTFPGLPEFELAQLSEDVALALSRRPEFVDLSLEREQQVVKLTKARNELLPKLDATFLASKDVGARVRPSGSKIPFQLEVGVLSEVPLQRRAARGKIESIEAKIAQIDVKRNFVADKVTVELQAAAATLDAALRSVEQAQVALDVAQQALDLAKVRFEMQDIDLVVLNIYEQAVTDAQLDVIDSKAAAFAAELNYLASIGDVARLIQTATGLETIEGDAIEGEAIEGDAVAP